MSLFTWKPEYSVNEAVLDSHHQKLFQIINAVYENVMNSSELDCIVPKINELSAYTNSHFSSEEQYMRERGFPGIKDHIAQHREFTYSIETMRARYHDNDLEVTRELIVVLGEWLLRHVIKEDKKYSDVSTDIRE